MRTLSGLCVLAICATTIFSCNNDSKKESATPASETVQPKAETTATAKPPAPVVFADTILKNIEINEKYFKKKTAAIPVIKKELFDALDLGKIPSPAELKKDPAFKIKIIDTLINNEKSKSLIVSVESENESWAWLLLYEPNGKATKVLKVFYEDFVEYISKTSTQIKDNKISIVTETEGDEGKSKQVENYIFRNGDKIESIK